MDFCIKKRINIKELEPKFFNKNLDIKIEVNKKEILIEACAPTHRITDEPLQNPISKIIEKEIKKHKIYKTNRPIIILIMLNSRWWGNNPLNEGRISDFMFYPIKVCLYKEKKFDENISGALIKKGNFLYLYENKEAKFPLPQEFIKIATKNFSLTKMIENLRYKLVEYIVKKKFFKKLKKYPEEEIKMRKKGFNPREVIENHLALIRDYPF